MTVDESIARYTRTDHTPGEPGMWVIIFGDIFIFVGLFCMFLWYRSQDPPGFDAAQQMLSPGVGLVETLVLLTSSLAVVRAVASARTGNARASRQAITIAMALGAVFVVAKTLEWWSKVDAGFTPHTNTFFMLYFVLTGLHLGHVFVGLFFLSLVRNLTGKAVAGQHDFGYLEGAGIFWHMVDLIWLLLFPLIYLVH
ncbi:cytochrome c oxidase subunit 3 [Antrihabitans sp. YC2-6]|uniref:cytochrome c oxidase subunit 3 n=1 Tax=Antrihabitans sp. YC2-6 TaxID=2799498 RepID=UPI0018F400EB|nr:cytochrome c oxidase subunit 3 [Antrihabitans sp. YC2-6]MBJ8345195.1 cytochrome c oxidase subunit 3 [Antrihabitans sp. YC2-6]